MRAVIRAALFCLALMTGAAAGTGAPRLALTGNVLQGVGVNLEVPFSTRGASQFALGLRGDFLSVSAGSRWFFSAGHSGPYVASFGYVGVQPDATEYGGAATVGYRWPFDRRVDLSVEVGGSGVSRREFTRTTGRAGLMAAVEVGYRF